MNDRADRLLGRAAVAMSFVLVAVLAGTLASVAWPRLTGASGTTAKTPPPAYQRGATIDTPAEWHRAAPHTLLLFARSSCSACQAARSFFTGLIDEIEGPAAVVLVTSVAEHDADIQYGRELGLEDTSIKKSVPGLKVRVTPTLVLVNRQGTILDVWEGVGPADKQAEIRSAITNRLASPSAARPDTPSTARNSR